LQSLKIIFKKYFNKDLSDISPEHAGPFVKKVYRCVSSGFDKLNSGEFLVPSQVRNFLVDLKCLSSGFKAKKTVFAVKQFLAENIETRAKSFFIKELIYITVHNLF
jgi:hypothetical protein